MLLADVAKFLADEDLVMSMERLPGGSSRVALERNRRWPHSRVAKALGTTTDVRRTTVAEVAVL